MKAAALFLTILLASLLGATWSAVFSVDLGSEWMKVAVVDVKPGQNPITIALNEMSKRKSPALVAFSSGNRMLAEEAVGITARYPERVYSRVRDMAGKPSDAVRELASLNYLPYDFVEAEGVLSFRVEGDEVYRAEELLGMILGYCRRLAEATTKSVVKDAVITVPPFFGQAERRAVVAAAQATGINVLSLMNEDAAAALDYGIDKDFGNGSKTVLFYDMGANSAYAAVVHFSAYTIKQGPRNVSNSYLEVKGIRWDADVGGHAMELRLVDHFAREFEKQTGVDVRKLPKAMAKMKKQAKRTKEILSANTEATFSVESLHDDRDFKSTITRQMFEDLCSDLWERATVPLTKVLQDVGMAPEQLDAVELLGGATRVPKLQQALSQALGGKRPLERHLDSDEAIALGAALHAANLTDGIKLRAFGLVDGISYGVHMKVSGSGDSSDEVLVPRLKKVPLKIARAVKRQDDFELSLLYDPEGELPPGVKSPEIAAFRITGLSDAASKYASHNLSAPIKAVLHFGLNRGGIVSLDRAEAVVEITELVTVKRNESTVNAATGEPAAATADPAIESNATNVVEEAKPEEKKLRKRTIRVQLKLEVLKEVGAVPEEKLSNFKLRLQKLDQIDYEKRQTEESKNNLESYIYTTKEMLESLSKDLALVMTAEQKREFLAQLEEAAEWLYTDGETASFAEFNERLQRLRAMGDPIFFRHEQLQARPAASEAARKYLSELGATLDEWRSSKPWISDAEVVKQASSFSSWLESKQAEQAKLASHENPAFSASDVYDKLDKLVELVVRTSKKPKPKPRVEKAPKNESGSGSESSESPQGAQQEEKQEQEQEPPVTVDEPAPQTTESAGEEVLRDEL